MDSSRCRKTTIQDLPNELLTEIFKRLVYDYDLGVSQLVCHRWYSIVDETIGRKISVASNAEPTDHSSPEFVFKHSTLSLSSISKLGVKSCCFEYTDPDANQFSKQLHKELPSLKYPYLLTNLYLRGLIHSNLFRNFLTTADNLVVLEISLISLSHIKTRDLKYLKLPKLNELTIGKCMRANWNGFNEISSLPKLQTFLKKNTFPELLCIDARFPVEDFRDFCTLKILIDFIQKHFQLKELQVTMDFPAEVKSVSRHTYQGELDNILSEIRSKEQIFNPNLKSLEVQGIRLHGGYPQLKIWQEFILKLNSLSYVRLRLGALTNKFLKLLSIRNGPTLQQLFAHSLDCYEEDRINASSPLNCKSFSSLKCIRTLYALGSNEVTGCSYLPSNLSSIFLTGAMRTEDADHILFNLPNMRFVSFRNAYDQKPGYGVSLAILHRLIQARKIHRFILNGTSLCEDFPVQGIPNGDPVTAEILTIYEGWNEENSYLDWGLNKENYYINKYY